MILGILALAAQAQSYAKDGMLYITAEQREIPASTIVEKARCKNGLAEVAYTYGDQRAITRLSWNGRKVSKDRLVEINRIGEVEQARVIHFGTCYTKAKDGFNGIDLAIEKYGRGLNREMGVTRYFFIYDDKVTERAPVALPWD